MRLNQPLRFYATAILIIAVFSVVASNLRDILTLANFTMLYLLIVIVIAIQYGTGPALVASVASFMGLAFFVLKPIYNLAIDDPHELFDATVFFIVSAISGQLGERVRHKTEEAQAKAREQEILYRLTRSFNQLTTDTGVYDVLTDVVRSDLAAQQASVLANAPEDTPSHSHIYNLPLQSGTRVYGTLQAAFKTPLPHPHFDLLKTCVSQAAMALERIDLTARANKSRQFEEADKLKTAILQAVSHDLRTPITIIKSSANNLQHTQDSLTPNQQQELAATIEQEADILNKLVGNLLDMSRLQAGELALNCRRNSLEEVASEAAARIWDLTQEERIILNFGDELMLVDFDYDLILQAVLNMIENALRYEPPDQRIEICGEINGDTAILKIINHGPTIPEDVKTQIMQPFYSDHEGHIGLGLPIARGIIEAHRGRLWVDDTQGGGATFVIALPYQKDEGYENFSRG